MKGGKPNQKRYLHRSETRYECRQCGDVAVCVDPCVEVYHEDSDYRRTIETTRDIQEEAGWQFPGELQ